MENQIDAAAVAEKTHYRPRRRHVNDKLPGVDGKTLGDYWGWAYSDIMENVQRAIFAEFLVASALGLTEEGFRIGWLSYDLQYGDKRIEVKSSAYLQTWYNESLSTIIFGVAKRLEVDPNTARFGKTPGHYADAWVFALFEPKEHSPDIDVVDANLWCFFVVSNSALEAKMGDAKTASLATISTLAKRTTYPDLRAEIERVLGLSSGA